MATLTIIVAPDPRLKITAEAVASVDDDVRGLMDDMLETMHAANGVGLAAPQVGVAKRVIVIDVSNPDDPPQPMRLANPEIVWESEEMVGAEEGCLSLPEHYADVTRPERIRVRYLDGDNQPCEQEADGLLARCIQHEIDHLDGTLFVDHLSSLKRNIILRKLSKSRKQLAPA
ncbi:MAG: peptide deformylase [Rhodospirillales bacterium]|nr:peptide deformylase [Rhodospirillales bacterium]